jgi:hypothetical protein
MAIRILNSFSINMLETTGIGLPISLVVVEITKDDARRLVEKEGCESAVGHPDTARILGQELGIELPMNRTTVRLAGGHVLVGQYSGERLPEGVTRLPEGAAIRWFKVSILPPPRPEAVAAAFREMR